MLRKFSSISVLLVILAVMVLSAIPFVPSPVLGASSFSVRTAASADDCYVGSHSSVWTLSLTDTQSAGYYDATYNKRGGGMRFLGVTIPQGSTITSAYITFTAKTSGNVTTVNTVLIGEDVDDAATFSDIANYQARRGTVVGGANDNYLTTASVDYNSIAAWTENTTYNSADISTIVQEIVNRTGWASGNDMVIFWDDHAGNSSETNFCMREAYSYNSSSAKAPLLYVEYTEAGTGGAIDIGPAATNRAGESGYDYTYILVDNPANTGGKLTSVQVYAPGTISDMKVGTFSGSSGTFTCRDYADLGEISSGDNTYTTNALGQDLSIEVDTGDYLGFWCDDAGVDEASSGGGGVYYRSGDWLGDYSGAYSYSLASGYVQSVYATGDQLNTVGSDPISTTDNASSAGYTRLDLNNPSDKNGQITSIEVWSQNALTDLRVGTFYGSGLIWTCRDYEDIGAVSAGQQVESVTLDVQVGDVLGSYFTTASGGGIYEPSETYGADGKGLLYLIGNWVLSGGSKTYTLSANTRESIQGTMTVTGAPVVSTDTATSITTSGAQLNGTISSTGGYTITSRGFYWGLTTGYGNTYTDNGSYSTGSFNTTLTSLASSTIYHYKAWATNSVDTSVGTDKTFTTSTTGSGDVTPYQGYSYAQQFTIQGSTAGAATNIPFQFHIYKSTGTSSSNVIYLNNNCNNFPNDIIFTSTDGQTLIPFYQETQSTSDVWVWANIPLIPAYPATTYGFISYGNPLQTTSLSNGSTTFTFYDSFSLTSGGDLYNGGTPVIACETPGTVGDITGTHSEVLVNDVWHTYYEAFYPLGNVNPSELRHATSTDGKNWTTDNEAVIDHEDYAACAAGIGDPSVTYRNGTFYLYVDGCDNRLGTGYESDQILLFTSTNGYDFTLIKDNILPQLRIISDVFVMWDTKASLWRLWYADWTAGTGPINYMMTSTDGLNFDWNSKVLVSFPIAQMYPMIAQVFIYNSTYYMMYFSYYGDVDGSYTREWDGKVILCGSSNAINWTVVKSDYSNGYDCKLNMVSEDEWWFYHSTLRYDTSQYNAYVLSTLEDETFLDITSWTGSAELSDDPAWVNYISTSATIEDGLLKIVKSSLTDQGVRYITQLPATCVIGWKMTDYSSSANNYATGSILNISGTGAASNEISVQQQNDGDIIGYSNTVSGTIPVGTGSLSTQYNYVVRMESSTTISVLVRGYTSISLVRTSSSTNFFHFGWSPPNANFAIDDFFIGKILTPTPTVISWAGGSSAYNGVTTNSATSILLTSAVLNGTVTSIISGHTITKLGFDYGTTTSYGTESLKATSTYTLGSFSSSTITGLTGGATYHFRAKMYDDDDDAWTYGGDKTFTTIPISAPTVSTGSAASISTTEVTLQGTLSGLGDYTTVYVSFEYGTSTSYSQSTVEDAKTAIGIFNYAVTGLTKSTTYYFRARVRYGASSYVYGSDQTFTTSSSTSVITSTSVDIEDATIFTNYLMGGDQLIVISYKCLQGTDEDLYNVKDYYSFQIYDGTFLVAQVDVPRWGYGPASIYLSASNILDSSKEYSLKLTGKSSKYASPISDTHAITGGAWGGSDMDDLRTWVLDFADRMGNYYDTTYITYTQIYGRILNSVGAQIFSSTIPSLQVQVPELFSSQSSAIVITPVDPSKPYEDEVEGGLGTTLVAKFDALGTHLGGVDGTTIAGFIWMLVCVMCIGGAMIVFKSAEPSIFVILPLLFLGGFWGILSLTIIGVTVTALLIFGVYRLLQPS